MHHISTVIIFDKPASSNLFNQKICGVVYLLIISLVYKEKYNE